MFLDIHFGASHQLSHDTAHVQPSQMGWLPWTWDEEPRNIPECRQYSPREWDRIKTERLMARIEQERQEQVALQKEQQEERVRREQWERDAPKRKAEEERRQREAAVQQRLEARRQWLQEQARLKQEAEEKRARAKECYMNVRKILFEFLNDEDFPRGQVYGIVDQAWSAALERSERQEQPLCDQLFEDVLDAVDTDLLTYTDVKDALYRAIDDANKEQDERRLAKLVRR